MEAFQSGQYVRQGSLDYRAFVPTTINREWQISDADLLQKLGTADRFIGRLDAFADLVDIDLYVRLHVAKEATLSARIEGTQTNVEEALLERRDVVDERRDDWEEVNNYISAINTAQHRLGELPLSSRLIRELHAILMQGVRGSKKGPGEFRRSQNWIGGTGPHNATFVPPPCHEVDRLMSDLERFVHSTNRALPELLKAALLHYQFETIHPFQDGNGRLGRLLIPLYLMNRQILRTPVLYLSAYFEDRRLDYYEQLMRVRLENDLLGWFHFFLDGVIATARDGVATFQRTLALERSLPDRLSHLGGRRANALALLPKLFATPIVDAARVSELIDVTPATAYKLIAGLEEAGILAPVSTSGRARKYAFRDYLDLFK